MDIKAIGSQIRHSAINKHVGISIYAADYPCKVILLVSAGTPRKHIPSTKSCREGKLSCSSRGRVCRRYRRDNDTHMLLVCECGRMVKEDEREREVEGLKGAV